MEETFRSAAFGGPTGGDPPLSSSPGCARSSRENSAHSQEGREAEIVESEEHHARSAIRPVERYCPASAKSATAQPCWQANDKRITKTEHVLRLDDLGDDQEPEVLPPGRRSDRLFFKELFFAVD